MAVLRKAGSNWVDGDRFFDRQAEIDLLKERVRNGTHTLLTAQRRMGKTSLVRELLRRLAAEGEFETVFVDLEDAGSAADAVVEIGIQSRAVHGAWRRIKLGFANALREVSDRADTLALSELRVKLRAGIDVGRWRQKGDAICAALAENERPVVLAIDELPILVNRMLKDADSRIVPEGKCAVDEFLSWLRRNGQEHRERLCLIVSGSVSLEPILRQAGLSAHANIFSPFELRPWNQQTALECLAALAEGCGIDLPPRRSAGHVPAAPVLGATSRSAVLRRVG
ncbi:MAG: ATP-binding protein [Acidobacteria bacterium]|nr:ATP-binding protein [Acidobacteriota bacterium]